MRILYHRKTKDSFIIKVDYSSAFSITLPLYSAIGYNYHFKVQWGDGSYNWVYSATDINRIHTYASGGTYTITMTGTLEGWRVNNAPTSAPYIIEVTQWGNVGIKNFEYGFSGCTRLTACSGKLDTSELSSLYYMFNNCTQLVTLDVSDWNVINVTNLNHFAYNCSKWAIVDVSGWDVDNVTNFGYVFTNVSAASVINVNGWNISKGTIFEGMLQGCSGITSLDLSGWVFKTTVTINITRLLAYCSNITSIGDTNTSGWTNAKFNNVSYVFASCAKLTSISCSNWDVSNVQNFSYFVSDCTLLSSIDVSDWNVSNGTNFIYMFRSCQNLLLLDLSSWIFNTSVTIPFTQFCYGNTKLTSIGNTNTPGWNSIKFSLMNYMFNSCSSLSSLDVANWNVSYCTNFQNAFSGTQSLSTLDVSKWILSSTSNITLQSMFYLCGATVIDVSGWSTNKVINCYMTFANTKASSIDIISWDMSNVTNNAGMFENSKVTSITAPSSLIRVDNRFAYGCNFLTVYNFYPLTAPTVSGTPFGNYAKPLHVPVGNSGYNVAPWTNTAIFSSVTYDL